MPIRPARLLVLPFCTLALAASAETVVLRDGQRVVGKVARYGDFLIVAPDPDHPRILDTIMVEDVSEAPPSAMVFFLDLPEDGSGVPDLAHVRFYPTDKAKVRHLLDLATSRTLRSDDPVQTRLRACRALKAMGKAAEEELFACVVPSPPWDNEDRVALALECLRDASPKGMEKRLAELAMLSGGDRLWRLAAEELKRRYARTPPAVLEVLTGDCRDPGPVRTAADVVGVIRDEAGIAAIVKALFMKGHFRVDVPRLPLVGGATELEEYEYVDPRTGELVKAQRLKPGGMRARDREGRPQLIRIRWLDEEVQFKEVDERIAYRLVKVLEEISGERFKTLKDVDDWWGNQPHGGGK